MEKETYGMHGQASQDSSRQSTEALMKFAHFPVSRCLICVRSTGKCGTRAVMDGRAHCFVASLF